MTTFSLIIVVMLQTGLSHALWPETFPTAEACGEKAQQVVDEAITAPGVVDAMTICIGPKGEEA